MPDGNGRDGNGLEGTALDGARLDGKGLRLDAVGRRYGVRGPWVLRDVAFEVPGGSLVRVEGANGSGKSTLLRIVAGADAPTAGRVRGRPEHTTAYVPERFPAALPFPVLRYLTHLGALRGLTAATARARALAWLDRFGIAGHTRTPLDELSKGTCQKVAVTQALLAEPRLLVLDEAWSGLDPEARAVLDQAVRERVAAGATVFFVDHDPRRLAGEETAVYAVGSGRLTVPARVWAPARMSGAAPVWAPESVPASGPASAPGSVSAPAPGGHLVHIEAHGGGEVPSDVRELAEITADPAAKRVRVVVSARDSDGVLRALLTARPPWHIAAVRPTGTHPATPVHPAHTSPAPVPAAVPRRRRAAVPVALFRYQADLLLRSHRWLAPLIFYGAVLAIGVAGGEPLLGSLGYAAALLVPVAAWMVRVCVTNEPPAARACVASAVGPARAQRGALRTALAASGVLGAAGTAVVAAISGPHSDDMSTSVPVAAAVLAGLMAAAVSALLGTAVGALTNPPLLRGTGWSMLGSGLGAGAVLLIAGSPAQAAVTGLVTGSRTGAVHYPLLALPAAAVVAAAAVWASGRAVARFGNPRA